MCYFLFHSNYFEGRTEGINNTKKRFNAHISFRVSSTYAYHNIGKNIVTAMAGTYALVDIFKRSATGLMLRVWEKSTRCNI